MKRAIALFAAGILMGVGASTAHAEAPDLSTPKKAGVAFARALESGDMTLAKTLATGPEASWTAMKLLSDMSVGMSGLQAAVIKKFGEDNKLPEKMLINLSANFESRDEKIEGDKATLVSKSNPTDKYPPTLKKNGNEWKMDLSNMSEDPGVAAMGKTLEPMIKRLGAITADVAAGKYKSNQEVIAAVTARG